MKKKLLALLLCCAMAFGLAACGSSPSPDEESTPPAGEQVDVVVFAAASMTETLNEIAALYKEVAPNVNLIFTFDSSGTLKTQIQEGAPCDLFISASPKQMNQLDISADPEVNTEGLDFVDSATRLNLLENKVVLAVPGDNAKGLESYDQLSELLRSGDVMLAIGNSDVPVGQYTQKIFAYYGLDEAAIAPSLTYGSNVKEVTTQVSEGLVDCGIIYATDAFSAGLSHVDEATAEMCGQVIYPAALLKGAAHPAEAQAFLDFLQTDAAAAVFEAVGFTMVTE